MSQDDRYSIELPRGLIIIPQWLIFSQQISAEARILAQAILYHQQCGDGPPSRDLLAANFNVVPRTVDRWLDELRGLKVLQTHRDGKRFVFGMKPRKPRPNATKPDNHDRIVYPESSLARPNASNPANHDKSVYHDKFVDLDKVESHDRIVYSDSSLARPNTSNPANHDKSVYHDKFVYIDSPHLDASNPANHDKMIDSAHGGGGGGDSSIEESPTTNTNRRGPLKTPLARWLKHQGMVGAFHFDDEKLDFTLYRRDFERKRGEGWSISRIVDAWLDAPLDRELHAAILQEQPDLAGDLPGEDEPASEEPASDDAWREQLRQQLIESANKRPAGYHGGRR